MNKTLITVSSVTYAIKARDLLSAHGYRAYIEATPGHIDKFGCSYSVSINGDADQAEELLRNHGIKILGRIDSK